ncbi:MAG TPA: NUDIX hydrolase [Ktedonobacterales bacterium]|nr:NUDIX hydrolase [Ktedonobacterales bacterium]
MSKSGTRRGEWDEPEQPWTTLTSEQPYMTPWLAIRRDTVRTHTGDEITYSYMERPDCVAIVPVTATGEMLLLRQYRYPIRAWRWEIPMGGIEEGEDAEATVSRELLEEAGGLAASVRYITAFYTANGAVRQQCMVYLARDVERRQTDHEPTELIHVTSVPVAEALRMAHAGEITDSLSALSILLCEPYLSSS